MQNDKNKKESLVEQAKRMQAEARTKDTVKKEETAKGRNTSKAPKVQEKKQTKRLMNEKVGSDEENEKKRSKKSTTVLESNLKIGDIEPVILTEEPEAEQSDTFSSEEEDDDNISEEGEQMLAGDINSDAEELAELDAEKKLNETVVRQNQRRQVSGGLDDIARKYCSKQELGAYEQTIRRSKRLEERGPIDFTKAKDDDLEETDEEDEDYNEEGDEEDEEDEDDDDEEEDLEDEEEDEVKLVKKNQVRKR